MHSVTRLDSVQVNTSQRRRSSSRCAHSESFAGLGATETSDSTAEVKLAAKFLQLPFAVAKTACDATGVCMIPSSLLSTKRSTCLKGALTAIQLSSRRRLLCSVSKKCVDFSCGLPIAPTQTNSKLLIRVVAGVSGRCDPAMSY